jgi:U3 small nucleolar RNA-associated protein 12
VIAAGHADGSIVLYFIKASDGQSVEPAEKGVNVHPSRLTEEEDRSQPLSALGGIDHAILELCETKQLPGHRSGISCLNLSSDSFYLASGSRNGDVTLWDVWSEQILFQIRGLHMDLVSSLRFLGNLSSAGSHDVEDSNERDLLRADRGLLLSSGKDAAIKLVDIRTQECVQTLLSDRSEIWCTAFLGRRGLLFAGTNDGSLHMWRVSTESDEGDQIQRVMPDIHFSKIGQFRRPNSRTRLVGISADEDDCVLVVYDTEGNVEFYEVRDEHGVKSHIKRRRKRAAKKSTLAEGWIPIAVSNGQSETLQASSEYAPQVSDYLCLRFQTKFEAKIISLACISKSIHSAEHQITSVQLIVHRANNSVSIEKACLPLFDTRNLQRNDQHMNKQMDRNEALALTTNLNRAPGLDSILRVNGAGHRRPVTALAFSDDFDQFLSASSQSIPLPRVGPPLILSASNEIRIWDSASGQCLCSIDLADQHDTSKFNVVAALFLRPPSSSGASFVEGKYAAIATDRGAIMILDCESGFVLETVVVATGKSSPVDPGIRAMAQSVSGDTIAVGGGCRFVSFYRLDFSNADQKWRLREAPRLELPSEVTTLCFTPNQELFLVALMDMTVRAFRTDTLAFALSFYGHKLPVTTMDVSGDSKLLITGSADKSCRIWGLQFGDCIRSLTRAHEDGVTVVRFDFINPRCFWSGGRDGSLRYWDADLSADRSCILTLDGRSALFQNGWGHRSGVVTAIAVSGRSELLASAGTDLSIRIWRRHEDQLVAGEERERQLQELFEADALVESEQDYLGDLPLDPHEAEPPQREMSNASGIERSQKVEKTLDSVAASDRIIEAMQKWDDGKRLSERSFETDQFRELIQILRSIRPLDYETAVSSLPLSAALLLTRICLGVSDASRDSMQCSVNDWDLVTRTVLRLFRDRFRELAAHLDGPEGYRTRGHLSAFRNKAQSFVRDARSIVGMNLAALRLLHSEHGDALETNAAQENKTGSQG